MRDLRTKSVQRTANRREHMSETDAARHRVDPPVRGVGRGAEVAWISAIVLALALAVVSGPGALRLLLSLGAVVGLVRLHARLDRHPPGGTRHRSGSKSEGTR